MERHEAAWRCTVACVGSGVACWQLCNDAGRTYEDAQVAASSKGACSMLAASVLVRQQEVERSSRHLVCRRSLRSSAVQGADGRAG